MQLTELPAILGGEPAVIADHIQANRWPVLMRMMKRQCYGY